MGIFTRDQPAPPPGADADAGFVEPKRTITASAQRIRVDDRRAMEALRRTLSDAHWQSRAWAAYNSIGEIHFAFELIGNLISRIRFFPAATLAPNVQPAYVGDTSNLTPGLAEAAILSMRRLSASSTEDISALARSLAINLCVPGDAYLVQRPAHTSITPSGVVSVPETWQVRSSGEIQISTDLAAPVRVRSSTAPAASATSPESDDDFTIPKHAFIARIWRRHPQSYSQADSSMRAVLDLCDELILLNQAFRSTARSRLNAGILYVPDGLSATSPAFPGSLEQDSASAPAPAPADVDEFEMALIDGMMTPIQDPSDVSATVPILVRGPAELGEKIRLISFERTFDPSLVQRADRVLDRILQGLDLPKEVVSGVSSLRYSNSIAVEETLWRAHVEPLALLVSDALTTTYLRPSLQAYGYTKEQADRVRVWYDPSEIVTRPNRSQDASTAYDRFALSSRALREALGFNEDDAPSPREVVMRLLFQKGPMTPETAEALMRVFAPDVLETARTTASQATGNALPPEVESALFPGAAPPAAPPAAAPAAPAAPAPAPAPEPAPAAEEPAPPAPAAEEPAPAPTAEAEEPTGISAGDFIKPPPKKQGPRAGAPAAEGPSPDIDRLPPFPRMKA